MRNKYYIVNVPPWGKVYYIVILPKGLSTMGEGLLYDIGIELGCIGRFCSSCSISGTRRVTMTTSLEGILY
jgi:hypothetical protein